MHQIGSTSALQISFLLEDNLSHSDRNLQPPAARRLPLIVRIGLNARQRYFPPSRAPDDYILVILYRSYFFFFFFFFFFALYGGKHCPNFKAALHYQSSPVISWAPTRIRKTSLRQHSASFNNDIRRALIPQRRFNSQHSNS